jgi:hypothetical protein
VAGVIALLAANAAAGAWQFIGSPVDNHPVANAIRVVLSVACIAAVARRRRSAYELSAWLALFTFVAAFPVYYIHAFDSWDVIGVHAVQVALALAVPVVLVARRASIFVLSKPAPGRFADLLGAMRLTVALFVVAEIVSYHVVRSQHAFLLGLVSHRDDLALDAGGSFLAREDPGLPTIAVLASSSMNFDGELGRPVAAILTERFRDRLNVLWSDQGGITTATMASRARRLLERTDPPRVAAFVLNVGFDDLHRSPVRQILKDIDVGESPAVASAVRWAVRHSWLLALSVKAFGECQGGQAVCWGRHVDETYPFLVGNVEELLAASAAAGVRVFVVTLSGNLARATGEYRVFIDRVNPFLRGLPARFPNVTLIDFAAAVEAAYPAGPGADCQPFEPGREPGSCGNEFHLGTAGHTLLADLLEAPIRAWLDARAVGGSP